MQFGDIQIPDIASLDTPELMIMAGLGLLVLLFGYRIKKIAFFIIWFLIGYFLAGYLMPILINAIPQITDNTLYQILIPVAGGLLLALLGFTIEKLCVGGICFALVALVTIRYFGTEMQTLAIGGVVGVILAGLAVMIMKPATIVATALAGAYAITMATLNLASNLNPDSYYWPLIIGITVVGSIFQFATTKRVS